MVTLTYKHGGKKYKIKGQLHRTKRKVKPVGVGKRTIFVDDSGENWVPALGKWWKFPQEIEY